MFAPPPVPYPEPHEQVGKAGMAVPPTATATGSEALHAHLREGDVLYIPRGFVHEANTGDRDASLHLTLALPSHDWSWAVLASRAAAATCQSWRSGGGRGSGKLAG